MNRAVTAALAAFAIAGSCHAALVPIHSVGSITHSAGFSSDSRTISLASLPSFSTNAYQYSTANAGTPAFTSGAAASTARAGMGLVTQPNFFGIGFATGTVLTQRGNADRSPASASTLRMDFSATWANGASNFGGDATVGASFGLIGSIPTGGAAFTQLIINATYHAYSPDNVAGAISLRGSITPDPFFYRATAGTFTFSGSDYVPSALAFIPAGWLVTIEGSVIMRVHNDQDEASLEFNRPGGVFPTGYGGDPSGQLTVVPLPAPSLAAGLGLIMIAARRRRRA